MAPITMFKHASGICHFCRKCRYGHELAQCKKFVRRLYIRISFGRQKFVIFIVKNSKAPGIAVITLPFVVNIVFAVEKTESLKSRLDENTFSGRLVRMNRVVFLKKK